MCVSVFVSVCQIMYCIDAFINLVIIYTSYHLLLKYVLTPYCIPPFNKDTNLFQVGVHIADVSHFIRPHTALDKEAQNRSTTVYLTNRRIDMVPGELYILCSWSFFVLSSTFSFVDDINNVECKFRFSQSADDNGVTCICIYFIHKSLFIYIYFFPFVVELQYM